MAPMQDRCIALLDQFGDAHWRPQMRHSVHKRQRTPHRVLHIEAPRVQRLHNATELTLFPRYDAAVMQSEFVQDGARDSSLSFTVRVPLLCTVPHRGRRERPVS